MKRLKQSKESKTENNRLFRVIELDLLRGPENITFNTVVEAKDVTNAIEIFYTRFPDAGLHIMVVPEEFVKEHKGYVMPKIAIKVKKKVPLIKLVK